MGKGSASGCGSMAARVAVAGVNQASFTVTPGVIDDAAREAYMNGQCAALAVALSELKGGQIIAIGYDDSSEDYEQWEANPSWGHVGFELEDGSILDIEGNNKDLDSWMERNQYWEARTITREEALSLPDFPQQDLGVARLMAKALLDDTKG